MIELLKNLIYIRTPFYKKQFYKIGSKSKIYYPSIIRGGKNISIGKGSLILQNSRIQIWGKSKEPRLLIGDNCYFCYNNSFLVGSRIVIEDDVLFASNILVSSETHGINPESDLPYKDQDTDFDAGEVVIGSGSWIGENAIILPGVKIGKKCIIGAGSVVTKSIPDYSMAVGNPARVVKKWDFEKHHWQNNHYDTN